MAPPESTDVNWVTVIGPAIGVALLAALAWLKSWFDGRREEDRFTPSGDIANRAVGAAFVDRAASDAVVGIAGDVRAIRVLHEERAKAEHEDAMKENLKGSVSSMVRQMLEDNKRDRKERQDRRDPSEDES